MMKAINIFVLLMFVVIFNSACDQPVNIFILQQDKDLGAQLAAEIEAKPTKYLLLNEALYPDAYAFLYAMRDEILISPNIKYKDDFEWNLKIIHDDNVVNAFCAPGGYLYVYTGLLKYVDKVDYLAAILAHEIAHIDRRHAVLSLTQEFGIDLLIDIANQNATPEQISQVADGLSTVVFSNKNEIKADEYSVDYLQITRYACNAAAGLFAQLNTTGGATAATFLGAHPNFVNRITQINDRSTESACETDLWHDNGDNGDYATMIATLP